MPVGAKSLWPERTKKSASRSCTSTFMCETDCAPSTSTRAPTRCAISTIVFAGVTVPSAFETCVKATILVLRIQELSELIEQQRAAVVDRRNTELRALGQAELLPRNDVGVMLEIGDDDFVARRRHVAVRT